jgi:hypothetical protein
MVTLRTLVRILAIAYATLWLLSRLCALEPAGDPALATVRIKSHGASATVIATREGRSWILGCAHMLTDKSGNPSAAMRAKKFAVDGPSQPHALRNIAPGPVQLLAWDYRLDLSSW